MSKRGRRIGGERERESYIYIYNILLYIIIIQHLVAPSAVNAERRVLRMGP